MDFVQNNLLLIAVALISGGMLLWPLISSGGGGPSVSNLEATQLINRSDGVVIDIRETGEFSQGRIIGSKHIPLGQLESRVGELKKFKTRPIIVYCESGSRSRQAITVLQNNGFEKAFSLSGGFASWQQAGLPVEK